MAIEQQQTPTAMTTLLNYTNGQGNVIHVYTNDRSEGICVDLNGKLFAIRCSISERYYANGRPTGSCDGLPAEVVAKLESGDRKVAVALTEVRANVIREFFAREKAEAKAAFEAMVPGFGELEAAYAAWYNNNMAHDESFERSMSSEHLDGMGVTSVDGRLEDKLADLRAKYPRASLYLDAKHQYEGAHWADSSGKGARGQRAMELLAAGASIEEAQAAMMPKVTTEWYAN